MTMRILLAGCLGLMIHCEANASETGAKPALAADMGAPIALSWVPPVYPPEAAARKLEGRVKVRFIVDETGAVTKARALQSSDKVFEDAAVQSVRQWRFEPAIDEGRKVARCMDVVLPFRPADLKRRDAPSFPPAEVSLTLACPPFEAATKTAGDDPEYPDALLPRHLPGQVVVRYTVDIQGRIHGVTILGATHTEFVRPALAALASWTFQPARQGDLVLPEPQKASVAFATIDAKPVDLLAANGVMLSRQQETDVATLDTLPALLILVDPVYPYDLLLAGKTGDAEAEFVIRENGSVEGVAVRSATEPAFGRALAAALECWAFSPARKGGEGVRVKATWRWHFGPVETPGVSWPPGRLVERLRSGDTAGMAPKGLDARPRPRYQPPPQYPLEIEGANLAGTAEVEFIIDVDGRCRLARIVSASDERLGWAAATAVERWVFEPPTRGGQAVDVRFKIPFDFQPPK